MVVYFIRFLRLRFWGLFDILTNEIRLTYSESFLSLSWYNSMRIIGNTNTQLIPPEDISEDSWR